jgi:putative membrane protein
LKKTGDFRKVKRVTTIALAAGGLWSIATELAGTLVLRPYVFGFLAFFLFAGIRDLGRARTLALLLWGAVVALVAELVSTRVGIPFGLYHYTGDTRGAELFLGNVPFFSPLSFPFLAYAALCRARGALGPAWASTRAARARTVLVGGVLMMLMDVVIDPLAVRGGRWFLGHLFDYPEGGIYFGVPLSNFLGWLVVGWVTLGGLAWTARGPSGAGGSPMLGSALFYLVLAVNLTVTLWIGETIVAATGIVVHAMVFLLLYSVNRVTVGRWPAEPLPAPIVTSGGSRP